jgi:hypothetical protein
MAELHGFYIPGAEFFWAPYGEGTYWFHQRCRDSGMGGGYLYWWAASQPDTAYPYTPPAGGPAIDVVLLAEFTPTPAISASPIAD